MRTYILLVLAATCWCTSIASAQQGSSAKAPAPSKIWFVVIVADKAGHAIADLRQQDFSVYDNDSVRPITDFRLISGKEIKRPPLVYARAAAASSTRGDQRLPTMYVIAFDPGIRGQSHDYHQVGIRVDRPALRVLTRDGYYTAE